ncbi:MAG TPA: RNA polymerase sigma factor [Myxococcales bacterium LLY-WYZ-16_1]|jgi:RNA polymerase sigma-70 factor, ECF subfamily|nr:RNA polymerase sigma factor [Myxococcales bacterium LLY-WYZ-16_1]
MAPAPDPETIHAAVRDDREALEEVLRYLHPIVFRFLAFRFSGLREGVEDATQDTLVAVIQGLRHYRGQGSLKAWALRIAFRTARRHQDRGDRPDAASALEPPDGVFRVDPEDRGLAVDMLRALGRLTEKKRDALILTEVFDLTAVEAASVLGSFENTVRSRCRHAKAELADFLETKEDGHGS